MENTHKWNLWERIKWWYWDKIGRKRASRRINKAIENGSFFKFEEE